MKCLFRPGNMTRGTRPLQIDRQGIHVALDKVSAWVCMPCGEWCFEEDKVGAAQTIVKAVDEQVRKPAQPA